MSKQKTVYLTICVVVFLEIILSILDSFWSQVLPFCYNVYICDTGHICVGWGVSSPSFGDHSIFSCFVLVLSD
uniref:Uncharacterized protein n=1 Tax=Neogobius melanostomus TaxID=47308 RepID=A0A8C6SJD6_9GOBI